MLLHQQRAAAVTPWLWCRWFGEGSATVKVSFPAVSRTSRGRKLHMMTGAPEEMSLNPRISFFFLLQTFCCSRSPRSSFQVTQTRSRSSGLIWSWAAGASCWSAVVLLDPGLDPGSLCWSEPDWLIRSRDSADRLGFHVGRVSDQQAALSGLTTALKKLFVTERFVGDAGKWRPKERTQKLQLTSSNRLWSTRYNNTVITAVLLLEYIRVFSYCLRKYWTSTLVHNQSSLLV